MTARSLRTARLRPYAAAATLVVAATAALGAAPATAEDAVPTTTSAEAPSEPLPEPKANEYAVGQSVQIRLDADGKPNSAITDFRWAVTQVTVQGPDDGTQEVPVPEDSNLLRSLQDFSRPPQTDGVATYTVDVEDGYGLARSVGLAPKDYEFDVALEVAFTLDGEPISAADLVGKSGVVTAQYTVKNLSRQTVDVEIKKTGTGQPETRQVEADVPMIVIAKTLLPTRFTGLNAGAGQFGADGRGNNQVQWVALPFAPLAKDGSSTFGWAANVRDAVIPSMLIQVAPVYIPKGEEAAAEPGTPGGGLPAPGLDPAVAQIQAGVADLILGLQGFASSGGGTDPLDALEGKLNAFFTEFGSDLQAVSAALDPNNPESAISLLAQALPLLQKLEGPVGTLNENWDSLAKVVDGLVAFSENTPGPVTSDGAALCLAINTATGSNLANSVCVDAINTAIAVQPKMAEIGGNLEVLAPLLTQLTPVLEGLLAAMTDLSAKLGTIGAGLAASDIDLPALDAVVSQIVSDVLASPNGQLVTGGLGQISSGIGQAKVILTDYLTTLITAAGSTAAGAAGKVDGLKAEVGGMLAAAHTSPLPYGGNPAAAPQGTVLSGAYEFRVDAADTNEPLTVPRILVGLLLLVGAGIGALLIDRRRATPATAPGATPAVA